MFFYLSKSLMWFASLGNIVSLLFLVGVALLFLNKIRWAKIFCGLSFLLLFLFGSLSLGSYIQNQLENRFPVPEKLPNEIEGIIVLGGVLDATITDSRKKLSLNGNIERVTSLIPLTKKYPDTTVIFTGGSGLLKRPDLKEAVKMKPLLQAVIQKSNKLVIENKARNTYENAVFTKKRIMGKGQGPWILVTSAFHMPRSVGVYRQQGINIIPYPVDFKTRQNVNFNLSFSPISGITGFDSSLHEWLGLFAYYLTGKTSQIFPAP